MGRHADDDRGRGFANWLVGSIIAAVLVIGAVVAYIIVINNANDQASGACSADLKVSVIAGPGAAPALAAAAGAYNKTKPVVRSSCITAVVTTAPDAAVLDGLTGHWPIKELPAPDMWIPDSTASLSALDSVRPELAAGHATDPFAWSPVVLAMRSDDAKAIKNMAWSDLATASGPHGTISLGNGRHLILALPTVANARASSYALQAVVADTTRGEPVKATAIESRADTLRAIQAGHGGQSATTAAALSELSASDGSSVAGAPTAVPVVEADLVRFDRQSGSSRLTAVHPAGGSVGDALIAAPISASWTGRTVTAAASDFQSFLTDVAGQQILADNGWRTVSAHPADPLPEVNTQQTVTMIPAGGPAVDSAIAVALGQIVAPTTITPASTATPTPSTSTSTPPPTSSSGTTPPTSTPPSTTTSQEPEASTTGPILTIIVDVSAGMNTEDEGKPLIEWVRETLPALTDGTVTNQVGLWIYSDGSIYPPNGSPELVPTGPIDKKADVPVLAADGSVEQTVSEVRAKALSASIAALRPDGDRWAYGALTEALPKAAAASVEGRDNRVLLLTSGADDTPGMLRSQVLDAVRAVADQVRVDVVGLGSSVPVAAYTDIAAAGGGEYIPVTDPAKLGQLLSDFLTLGD